MNARTRKLLGGMIIILFVVLYAFCAIVFADSRPMHALPVPLQTLAYIVLGILWVFPLMPIMTWIQGGGRRSKA